MYKNINRYYDLLGSNVSAWDVAQKISNFNEVTESISVWKASSWGSDGLWQTYTGTGGGTNWTINTFDVIRVILTDDGTQTINMTSNPFIDYTITREISLTYGVNLGANYIGWTSGTSITAYDIANTNISTILDDWEQIWHWNRTTYSWSYYIVGFIEPTIWVDENDVLFIRVENSETLNIGGK